MTINRDTANIVYSAIHGLQNLSAGTGAAYTVASALQPLPAYETNRIYPLIPHVANTGACTVAYDGLAAVALRLQNGIDPPMGHFETGKLYWLRYDGTDMVDSRAGDPLLAPLTAGAANAYTLASPVIPITSYQIDRLYPVQFHAASSGASTIDIDGVGPVPVIDVNGNALVENSVLSGRTYWLRYDGTNMRLAVPPGGKVGTGSSLVTIASTVPAAALLVPLTTDLPHGFYEIKWGCSAFHSAAGRAQFNLYDIVPGVVPIALGFNFKLELTPTWVSFGTLIELPTAAIPAGSSLQMNYQPIDPGTVTLEARNMTLVRVGDV